MSARTPLADLSLSKRNELGNRCNQLGKPKLASKELHPLCPESIKTSLISKAGLVPKTEAQDEAEPEQSRVRAPGPQDTVESPQLSTEPVDSDPLVCSNSSVNSEKHNDNNNGTKSVSPQSVSPQSAPRLNSQESVTEHDIDTDIDVAQNNHKEISGNETQPDGNSDIQEDSEKDTRLEGVENKETSQKPKDATIEADPASNCSLPDDQDKYIELACRMRTRLELAHYKIATKQHRIPYTELVAWKTSISRSIRRNEPDQDEDTDAHTPKRRKLGQCGPGMFQKLTPTSMKAAKSLLELGTI